jgi:hypothetical protein
VKVLASVTVLLAACSGPQGVPDAPAVSSTAVATGSAPAPSATGSASAAPSSSAVAPPPLEAKLDGREAGFKSIIAKAYGKNELRLAFSSGALDCASSPKSYEADVTLNHVVELDGTRHWLARQASYVNGTKATDYGDATVAGDPSSTLTVVLPKISIDSSKEPKLFELSGTVVATGCGDVAKNPEVPRPQADAKLRFRGLDLPILGAILTRKASGDQLAVSTHALDCSGRIVEGEDLQVRVQLGKAEAYVGVRGALHGSASAMTLHKKEHRPTLKIGAAKGDTVKVTVGLMLDGLEKLELSGSVDALVCKDD